MEKPNCYKCVHRRDLPGDAHSACIHPKAGGKDPMEGLMALLASVGRIYPVVDLAGATILGIEANPHGIRKGWFNWPYNFDPVWLVSCDGFMPVGGKPEG